MGDFGTGQLRRPSRAIIGRKRELDLVRSLLREGRPLLTIVGTAGVGKTLLARTVAADLADGEQRTAFVSAASATNASDLAVLVCDALGARIADSSEPGAILAHTGEALAAAGSLLLVLDEVEHFAQPAATALSTWLDAAPETQWLVTSRERLQLPNEVVIELGGLAVRGASSSDADEESLRLWIERVRDRSPTYALASHELPLVAELVAELDGLPLAIELAAARYGTLPLATLVERLRNRIDLLSGPTHARSRHATLQAALDASWDGLEPWEKSALSQLSAFRGPIDLDDAERIVLLDAWPAAPALADVLRALRDKSLLVSVASEQGTALAMLHSVRKHAQAKLEASGVATELRTLERLAAHVAVRVARLAEDARGRAPRPALNRLSAERQWLFELAERCLAAETTRADGLRIIVGLERGLLFGSVTPGFARLTALTHSELDRIEASLRARTLIARGRRARRLGLHELALTDVHTAEKLGEALGDLDILVHAKRQLVVVLSNRNRMDDAVTVAREVMELAARSGSAPLRAEAHNVLAYALHRLPDLSGAAEQCAQAVSEWRELGDAQGELSCLVELAAIYGSEGDGAALAPWRARIDELRALVGVPLPPVDYALAMCALAEGKWPEAITLLDEVERLLVAFGESSGAAWVRGYRALALHCAGQTERACADLVDALISLERDPSPFVPFLYATLAGVEAARGRIERAETYVARAETLLVERPNVSDAARLCFCHVDLAKAARAAELGDATTSAALRAKVVAHRTEALASVTRGPRLGETPTALSWLSQALGQSPGRTASSDPSIALRIAADGSWFEISGHARVSCVRRPIMRRLLLALCERRRAQPGLAIPPGELFALGWPGDLASEASAMNRLHVMISRMRDEGLRPVLLANDEGYWFDARFALEVEP